MPCKLSWLLVSEGGRRELLWERVDVIKISISLAGPDGKACLGTPQTSLHGQPALFAPRRKLFSENLQL